MYSHEYNGNDYHPPMPVVALRVSALEEPDEQVTIEALLDSGADGTFLPERLLHRLGAESVREAWVSGIDDVRYPVNMYMAKIEIGPYSFWGARVVGDKQGRAIVGRDVLNQLVVTLNGLANTVDITQ